MSTMNVCILLGRLKDDPVIRRHSSGNDVATLVIEEVVVHRDRGSGAPVERTVNHQVRVYNQSFVNAAKAEGARGRHVEVHGALSYAEDGQAFVSVPPHGGRLAFKSFEVREIPHEPPPVVADHEAARDLAAAVPEPVAPALPDLGRPPERVRQDQEVGQPSAPAVDRATTDEGADRAPSDELVPQTGRTTVAARPPQIGVGRPSLVGGRSAPAQPPATTGQVRPPVQARMPGSVPNPPPTRPSVGGGAARTSAPSAGGAVAGVAQPRT
ncbi:single-stranded DNA-binding protein, partial [Methylobacterium hispanicum]